MTHEITPSSSATQPLELAPARERPALRVVRARMCNFVRAPALVEAVASALAGSRTHDALIEPRLFLELAGRLSEGEFLSLIYLRRPSSWCFEIEAARRSTGEAQSALTSLLRVAAPGANFKPSPAAKAAEVVTRLTPCADIVMGAGGTTIWLAPEQYVTPDLRRALAAADECGVSQIRFTLRPLAIDASQHASLQAARFRLENVKANCPRAAEIGVWLESGQGCLLEAQVTSAEPLSRDALDILSAALFGRAARSDLGAPSLDLRLAVPAGRLPAFRFWPVARDLVRAGTAEVPDVPESPGAIVLGFDAADDVIRVGAEDRMRHLFVLGGTGAGKSTLILNMLLEDIVKGEGVMLIDPHGDLADLVRASVPPDRRDDVVWIDAGEESNDWRLDLLITRGPKPEFEKSRIANRFIDFFRQQYAAIPEALGPCFEDYFRATILLLMDAEDPEDRVLTKFEDVLVDDDFRAKLLSQCKNKKVRQFWQDTAAHVRGENSLENIAPYITNKMTQISSNPLTASLVSGDKPRLDLREAMDARKIVLVRLSKGLIGDYDARFLGALFLMSLTEAALSRARLPVSERIPFRVYVDEFQTLATKSAAAILAECRKYGLCLTLAAQSLSQLEGDKFNPASVGPAILANCGSFALFRMSPGDALIMSSFMEGVSASDLTQLAVGEMMARRLVGGATAPAERLQGLPPNYRTAPPPGNDN